MNIKGPIEKANEIIQLLSYLTLFMLFNEVSVTRENGEERKMLEITKQSVELVQVYLQLINNVRT